MKRVIVIGCPGSGKSTFARTLHELTGLPLFYLDMMYWQADKTIVDKHVFLQRLEDTLRQDAWIIDGNYASTMEQRMEACDTVFFLDYPVEVCLAGIGDRMGKVRDDIPWVETEEDPEFVEFVRNYNRHNRPGVLELLEKYSHKNVHVFRERSQAREFLSREFIL